MPRLRPSRCFIVAARPTALSFFQPLSDERLNMLTPAMSAFAAAPHAATVCFATPTDTP
jgi:hypothetical protein